MGISWQNFGIVLAMVLLYATGVAWLTRSFERWHVENQTYFLVVIGVAGVLFGAGWIVGWMNVGIISACFAVAAVPMGIEYYSRMGKKAVRAAKAAEDLVDGHPCEDRTE